MHYVCLAILRLEATKNGGGEKGSLRRLVQSGLRKNR